MFTGKFNLSRHKIEEIELIKNQQLKTSYLIITSIMMIQIV